MAEITSKNHGGGRMSVAQQAMLSFYWFATNAQWSAILIILLPKQAEAIGGDANKGATVGIILGIGAFISMVAAPLLGAWSDRVRTRWGRRRPFLVVGTIFNAIGLIIMSFIPASPGTFIPYTLAFCWIMIFNNVATAPYSALIPDVVPKDQRGTASGWMGLMTMLGMFVGGSVGLFLDRIGFQGAYIALAIIMLMGMAGTVLTVKEPAPPEVEPFKFTAFFRGILEPFKSADFSWVFWTRFLVVMGTFTVQEFLQYYMRDSVAGGADQFNYSLFGKHLASQAHEANSYFMIALLGGAVMSAFAAGALSDKYGRKLMVYISGALQGLVAAVFIFSGNYTVALFMGLVFGLGYGAYQSVDWALASDVLPSEDDHAKDMGVWHIAMTMPQVLAPLIAGFLLDLFQKIGKDAGIPTLGYTVIFGLAVVYFFFGTVMVRNIRGVR